MNAELIVKYGLNDEFKDIKDVNSFILNAIQLANSKEFWVEEVTFKGDLVFGSNGFYRKL